MTKTEQYILERLDNLERAFLQSQVNNVKVTENSDIAPVVQIRVNDLDGEVAANTINIEDNSSGIYDLADVVSEDSESIYDLADIVSELDERVSALEEK